MSTPEFLRSLGLDFSSNSAVNAVIMTTLLSMVAAWSNYVWIIFKTLIDRLTKFVSAFVQAKILSRLTGKTVCTIEINQQNPLYLILERALLGQPPGHEMKTSYFQMLTAMATSAEQSWTEQYANFLDRHRHYDISIDYSGEKSFRFVSSSRSKHVKRYYYSHLGYGIKIVLMRTDKSANEKDSVKLPSTIDIELIDYGGNPISMEECPAIISSFLQKQFSITQKLPYIYTVQFGTEFSSTIERYATNWSNSNIGLLQNSDLYLDSSDASPYKVEQCYLPNEIHLSSRHENLSSTSSNSYLISEVALKSNSGFKDLYARYVGELPSDYRKFAYMFKRGRVYLFVKTNDSMWTLRIVTFGSILTRPEFNQIIDEFVHAESKIVDIPEKGLVSIFNLTSGIWKQYRLEKRVIETVYLPEKTRADIMSEITNFRQTEPLYRECGVPYRKGMLLHGVPGCGKTSLVKSLAYEFQIDIYSINVNDEYVNDETIITVLNSLGGNGSKILLFEDIDSAFADREKVAIQNKSLVEKMPEKSTGLMGSTRPTGPTESTAIVRHKFLTYSGLLNALDGALSNQHGVITIMTTNYIDKLGTAFIRPGRIDVKYELKECNSEQIRSMFRMFLKKRRVIFDKEGLVTPVEGRVSRIDNSLDSEIETKITKVASLLVNSRDESQITPCVLQQYLLKHIRSEKDMLDCYVELPPAKE